VKPPAFDYAAPDTLAEVLALLARHGDTARPLAGGQSLVPVLNLRLASPGLLVDLNRVTELRGIRVDATGTLIIGATTRHRAVELSPEVARCNPLLAAAMPWIAHVQIRNRGTHGGSLAHADPSAELPAVALASDAELEIAGPSATRRVAANAFFQGLFATALGAGELLVAARYPAWPARRRCGFIEVARRHGDYAIAGVAVTVDIDESASVTATRVVLFGVGDAPQRAHAVEAGLAGAPLSAATIHRAATHAADGLDARSDLHASAEYRRELAVVLTRRALEQTLAPRRADAT